MGLVLVSPVYEVMARWIEQYSGRLRIEAADEKAAMERVTEVWCRRAEFFMESGKFDDSILMGFEVAQCASGEAADITAAERLG